MKNIWNALDMKGRIEIVIHALVAVFILGTVYRGYTHLAERVRDIDMEQDELKTQVHALRRKARDIQNIEQRLKRIVDNQDRLRKLIIEYMKQKDIKTSSDK